MYMQRLKTTISAFFCRNAPLIIFLFVVLYAIVISFAQAAYYAHQGRTEIFDLGFGYGNTVRNIVDGRGNLTCFIRRFPDFCFHSARSPLITYFYALISSLNSSLLFAFIVKNLFVYSLSCYTLFRALGDPANVTKFWNLLLLGLYFFIPYNAFVASDVETEEAFIAHLLPFCAILIVTMKHRSDILSLSIALFLAIAIKITMYFVAVFFAIISGWIAFKKFRLLLLSCFPILSIVSAFIFSAYFTYNETGVFAIGPKQSSLSGWALYHAHNPFFDEYYPKYHTDLMHGRILDEFEQHLMDAKKNITEIDEWYFNEYFYEKGKNFIAANPLLFAERAMTKFYVYFISVMDHGIMPNETYGVLWSALANRVISCLVFLIMFRDLLVSSAAHENKNTVRLLLYFVMILILVSIPNLIGWGWHRHYVPVAHFVIAFWIFLKNKGKQYVFLSV